MQPEAYTVGVAGGSTIPYEFVNHYDANNATLDEFDQLYVAGAQGVPSSTSATGNTLIANPNTPLACMSVGDFEQLYANAAPPACARGTNQYVQALNCGLYSRHAKFQKHTCAAHRGLRDHRLSRHAARFARSIAAANPGGTVCQYSLST